MALIERNLKTFTTLNRKETIVFSEETLIAGCKDKVIHNELHPDPTCLETLNNMCIAIFPKSLFLITGLFD